MSNQMPYDILQKALKRKQQIEKELSNVRAFIRAYRRFTGMPKRTTKQIIIDAAKRILAGRDTPTKNAALAREIIESGVEINSATPDRYISAVLSHSDAFVAAAHRAGWLLKPTEITS